MQRKSKLRLVADAIRGKLEAAQFPAQPAIERRTSVEETHSDRFYATVGVLENDKTRSRSGLIDMPCARNIFSGLESKTVTCIPPKSNRTDEILYSRRVYRKRNLIERFFNKIKRFRRIATRYDRLAESYLAMIKLGSTRLWLRAYESAA